LGQRGTGGKEKKMLNAKTISTEIREKKTRTGPSTNNKQATHLGWGGGIKKTVSNEGHVTHKTVDRPWGGTKGWERRCKVVEKGVNINDGDSCGEKLTKKNDALNITPARRVGETKKRERER